MPRLTKRLVDTALVPKAGELDLWDDQLSGFGVRVYPSGRKVFCVRYRVQGRRNRLTIGRVGVLTVEQARVQAQALLGRVALGEDPAATRRSAQVQVTMQDLAARYLTEHAEMHKKPGSLRPDRYNLRLHILPALGSRWVSAVSLADVRSLHTGMRSTPGAANRCLALLSKMLSLAEEWGLRLPGTNPVPAVARYREQPRERYLTLAEVGRLGAALTVASAAQVEMPSAIACIQLLLLTGARVSEVLGLQWVSISWEQGIAQLPDSKTGRRVLYLLPETLRLLQGLPRVHDWVLPGRRPGRPLVDPHGAWYRLRAQAQLPSDTRLHDLRHTFASLCAQAGLSLPLIGALLGHRHPRTTFRYVHLTEHPLHLAASPVTAQVAKALGL